MQAHPGFTAKLALDLGLLMDIKPVDRVMWMSDMGWLVGPIPGMGVDITNPAGIALPPKEVGELVLRRPSIGQDQGIPQLLDRVTEAVGTVASDVPFMRKLEVVVSTHLDELVGDDRKRRVHEHFPTALERRRRHIKRRTPGSGSMDRG